MLLSHQICTLRSCPVICEAPLCALNDAVSYLVSGVRPQPPTMTRSARQRRRRQATQKKLYAASHRGTASSVEEKGVQASSLEVFQPQNPVPALVSGQQTAHAIRGCLNGTRACLQSPAIAPDQVVAPLLAVSDALMFPTDCSQTDIMPGRAVKQARTHDMGSFCAEERAYSDACRLASFLDVAKLILDQSLFGFELSLNRPRNLRGSEAKEIGKEHFVSLFNGHGSFSKAGTDNTFLGMPSLQPNSNCSSNSVSSP